MAKWLELVRTKFVFSQAKFTWTGKEGMILCLKHDQELCKRAEERMESKEIRLGEGTVFNAVD